VLGHLPIVAPAARSGPADLVGGDAGPPLLAAIVLRELAVLGGLAEPIVPTELAEPIVPVELAAAEQAGRLSALRRGRPDLLS
jgi:hypothetical protein